MNLRIRTLSIVFLAFAVMFVIQYAASSAILLGGFARLERDSMEQEVGRAQQAIAESLESLASHARDWGYWDDTYRFAADENRRYRQTNLIPATFRNVNLDLLLILRPDGSPIYAGQAVNGVVAAPPASLLSAVLAGGAFVGMAADGGVATAVVSVEGTPLLVAAAPILRGDNSGPSRGTLLMGRYLTSERLTHAAQRAQLLLSLAPFDEVPLTPAQPTVIRGEGTDRITGYLLLTDGRSRPAAVLKVSDARWIYAQGQKSQRYLLVNLGIAALGIVMVMFVLLERTFLARLARLDRAMALIRRERSTAARVPTEGSDELARLGVTINETLAALHETEERLKHDALHDPLTGLANRSLFENRLEAVLGKTRRDPQARFAVLVVDLDHFKLINDGFGHSTGDQLLRVVARRIVGTLRLVDLAARLGGDEFALLLDPVEELADASRCAERLLEVLREPVIWNDHPLHISASIGIAIYEGGYATAEQLLRDADTAMYRAKQKGRNAAALFDERMHEHVVVRLELEHELRAGIPNGELRAFYQPIFDLQSGRLSGFEALVRWQHRTRGLLAPSSFVPIAEHAGLIGEIDLWMLREACRCCARWQAEFTDHAPVNISVNLSCRQLDLFKVTEAVRAILAETGLPGGCIGLEITEGALATTEADLARELFELKALGVRLYLDDFGTGFSSLSRLHRLPIDVLKIDRSFVLHLADSDGAIAHTIVTMAHTLGMQVVAEGVETQEQMAVLSAFGCEYGQGYFFAKPLTEEQATALLRASRYAVTAVSA